MSRASRRQFLGTSLAAAGWAAHSLQVPWVYAAENPDAEKSPPLTEAMSAEPIIDIHQHTNYAQRTNEQMIAHQKAMGVTQTILLPSGTPVQRPSTNGGRYNGLGGVSAGGNETVLAVARQYPQAYFFGANEVTDLPTAIEEISKYIELGAKIIGEQKFSLPLDSAESQKLYALAGDAGVPILLHLQHGTYNLGFEQLPKMLEKYPKTVFIGHAQTWWANIDKNHTDQKVLYPKGKVTAGGLTDRYLADYPNMFADMSAGSGLNALLRDEDHTRGFLDRHQNKILYGSDCNDAVGTGPKCQGAQTIAAIRKFAVNKTIERKILYENAKTLFQL